MSDNNVELNMQNHDGGKKKLPRRPTKKRRTQKEPEIIVGKIYANWCGHCQALKPEWKKMRRIVERKPAGKQIQFVEIEDVDMSAELSKFREKHGVEIESSGFPTIFKFANGKVEYYEGSREAYPLAEWTMKGGEPQPQQQQIAMPRLFVDVQGGKRHTRRPTKTRRRVRTRGFFEKLFGYGV